MFRSFIVAILLLVSGVACAQDAPLPVPPSTSGPSGPVQVESVPQPDPTVLTTDQLRREIAALKELIFNIVDGKIDGITTRLDGSDKAVALLQETTDRLPALIKDAVDQQRAIREEQFAGVAIKFEGIEKQFEERDVRTEQLAQATEKAVVNALAAQDKSVTDKAQSAAEAIAKSEASTVKQIDGQAALIVAGNDAKQLQIDDLKARVQAIESKTEGQSLQRADTGSNIGLIFGAIGAAAVLVSLVVFVTRQPVRTVVATNGHPIT